MKYGITRLILGFPSFLEISHEEFERIRCAKANVILVLNLEEKLDIVLGNYAEYERELLDLTLHQMLFRDLEWSSFRFDVQLISRHLANLLSSGRLYVDQVPHDVSSIYGAQSRQLEELRCKINEAYDRSFAYRFMDAIRNYMQHRSLSVHQLSYPSRWVSTSSVDRLQFSIVPSLEIKRLQEDGKFKRSVLKELDAKGSQSHVNLTPLVREYVESIAGIHETVREMTSGDTEMWDSLLRSTLERAAAEFGNRLAGLAVVARAEDGRDVQSEQVLEDLMNHRKLLIQKKSPSR